jgi:hypothetical protein
MARQVPPHRDPLPHGSEGTLEAVLWAYSTDVPGNSLHNCGAQPSVSSGGRLTQRHGFVHGR